MAVTARVGRYGPFLQLGEGEKPKRSSIPKGMSVGSVTLEQALRLLALPREIGLHPEDGEPILASIGRFGPYVQHGKTYANLTDAEDVLSVGLNRAIDLIATKRAKGPGGFSRGAAKGKALGDHPDGGPIQLMDGRYGPYVAWQGVNATLPKSLDKEALTLEQAVALIRAKQAAGPPAKPARGKAAGASKAKAKPATGAKKAESGPAAARKPAARKKPARET
jgi:DNA topoisomerase-1